MKCRASTDNGGAPVRSSTAFSSGTRLPSPEPWSVISTTAPVPIRYTAPPPWIPNDSLAGPATATTARLTSETMQVTPLPDDQAHPCEHQGVSDERCNWE